MYSYWLKLKNCIKKYLLIDYSLPELRHIMQREGLVGGIHFLKKRYGTIKPASIRFLIEFYEYLLKEQSLFSLQKYEKPIVLHFSCWGHSYAVKARKYLFPSLLAEGNLPALAANHKVIIFIHCDRNTRDILFSAGEAERIEKYATIKIMELPGKIFKHYKAATNYPDISFLKHVNRRNEVLKYLLLGAFQTHALQESIKIQAVVSFLMPDVILSDSFFMTAMQHMSNKKLVATSTFRTNFNTVSRELERYFFDKDQEVLIVPAADMARMQIEHLHSHEKRRIVSENTKSFQASPRIIFKTNNGLMIRALQYHPVLLDCSKLTKLVSFDYCPIDDTALMNILSEDVPYQDQVWLCSDTSMMNIMELTDDDPDNVGRDLSEDSTLTYNKLIDSFCLMLDQSPAAYNNKLNRFFIKNKLVFASNENCYLNCEVIDNDLFIQDIYTRMNN